MNNHPNITPASPSLASPIFDASFDSIESLTTSFLPSALPTLETATVTEVALGYHRNGQYSITAMTTSSGAVAERYAFTDYGQPTILNARGCVLTSSAIGNRYTYTGREWDETIGLYHFRERWMSPKSGSFLQRDPIGYHDGLNLYLAYFSTNCTTDPLGLFEIKKHKCSDFLGNLPKPKDLPQQLVIAIAQLKHGPNVFCGDCKGFDAFAWRDPGSSKCTICFNDSKEFFYDEWVGLLVHELVHCNQNGCKGTKGGDSPTVVPPVEPPNQPEFPGTPEQKCAKCEALEEPAYRQQCWYLYPGPHGAKKRDECIETGVGQTCAEICKNHQAFVKDCEGKVFPIFEPTR